MRHRYIRADRFAVNTTTAARASRRFLLSLALLCIAGCGPESGGIEHAQAGLHPDAVIVVLHPAFAPGPPARNRARAAEIAAAHGARLDHAYGTALFGFSGTVPPGRLAALRRDRRVHTIEPVEVLTLVQSLPTGVDRVETDRNPTVTTGGSGMSVTLDLAILDTGIDPDHPDLNVAGGRNFHGGNPSNWSDGNGHGTHTAGTAAAIDNDLGVVGVAPGARLWAVRVCSNGGRCWSSDIVAGIDWVAEEKRSGRIDFAAANYSISSADSDRPCDDPANAIHHAICGLVDTGVVFVLAAGNENRIKTPFSAAFSVSAMADFDGMAGGAGAPTCRSDADDTLANFSNHGSGIDIAAPGVCIRSTVPGGYGTMSGTSMAAPHVTGAVALYLHANGLPPATSRSGAHAIRSAIVGAAHPQGTANHPCSYDDTRAGGPLLFVNAPAFGGDGTCTVAGDEPEDPADPDDPDDPGDPAETVTVAAVTYATHGGRNADRHLRVTVSVVDDLDQPVDGAEVTARLEHDGAAGPWIFTDTTGSDGTVTFGLNNAPAGCYETTVSALETGDLDWDGTTPANGHCK